MSSTNITQGDSKAVDTEEQSNIAFNVQVIAVPKGADDSLISHNKFDTKVDNESAAGSSTAAKEKQTDNLKEEYYMESNEYAINKQERFHDLKRNRSLFSVPTHSSVYTVPRISISENSNLDAKHEVSIKIDEQFNEEEEAGTSGVSIDISKITRDPIKASEKSKSGRDALQIDLQESHPNENSSSFSIKSIASVNIESEIVGPGSDSVTQLILKELEDDGSFVTIEMCQKEKMTSTDVETIFSLDNRTQNILRESTDYRNQPPPPYYESSAPRYSQQVVNQGRLGQTQVYQQQNVEYVPAPRDARQAPPYRRSEPDPENLFQTKEIRNKFIRRVYMILAIQLLFTFGFISLCIHEKHTRAFVIRRWELCIAAMAGLLTITMILVCYLTTRRTFPLNFILLSFMTICMAYILAYMSCFYKTNVVMLAMGVTAGICTLLSILACQTWFDITAWGMILCILMAVLMIYGFIAMLVYILTGSDVLYIVYSCLMTLLMCVYLIYDTQQILGGRRVEMSPEEYILGALTLFIDVVVIFQQILFLIGRCSR